jgi:hypothetical protein
MLLFPSPFFFSQSLGLLNQKTMKEYKKIEVHKEILLVDPVSNGDLFLTHQLFCT